MRVLVVSDIHGETEKLEEILDVESYEAILCAGDLSDAAEFEDYGGRLEEVLDLFEEAEVPVRAVPGNMDPEEDSVRALRDRRMNLHRNTAAIGDLEAIGYGGGKTPFGTPFEPDGQDIKQTLSTLAERSAGEITVAVVHQPPADSSVDVADGNHVGSEEVRELIEGTNLDLFLTGHIHESRGTDEISGTKVLNPGPVLEGFYAVVETDEMETELKEI